MEKEKTNHKIAIEQQKVAEITADTKKKEATIYAQMEAEVSFIKTQKEINETRSLLEKEKLLSIIILNYININRLYVGSKRRSSSTGN